MLLLLVYALQILLMHLKYQVLRTSIVKPNLSRSVISLWIRRDNSLAICTVVGPWGENGMMYPGCGRNLRKDEGVKVILDLRMGRRWKTVMRWSLEKFVSRFEAPSISVENFPMSSATAISVVVSGPTVPYRNVGDLWSNTEISADLLITQHMVTSMGSSVLESTGYLPVRYTHYGHSWAWSSGMYSVLATALTTPCILRHSVGGCASNNKRTAMLCRYMCVVNQLENARDYDYRPMDFTSVPLAQHYRLLDTTVPLCHVIRKRDWQARPIAWGVVAQKSIVRGFKHQSTVEGIQIRAQMGYTSSVEHEAMMEKPICSYQCLGPSCKSVSRVASRTSRGCGHIGVYENKQSSQMVKCHTGHSSNGRWDERTPLDLLVIHLNVIVRVLGRRPTIHSNSQRYMINVYPECCHVATMNRSRPRDGRRVGISISTAVKYRILSKINGPSSDPRRAKANPRVLRGWCCIQCGDSYVALLFPKDTNYVVQLDRQDIIGHLMF